MSNIINQERRGLGEPVTVPPEELERISRMPIIPPISQMLIESLSRNCVEPFIPPIDVD